MLAHFAGSPRHGMVYGHYFLAREWVKLGHSVTIVASSYVHTRFNNPDVKGGLYTEEYIDGIRYLWIKTPRYDPDKNAGRAINILTFSFLTRFLALPLEGPDVIVSTSHHTLAIFPAIKLARQYSSELIYEVRDLWPLSLIEIGGISPRNPFIRLLQYAEDLSYKSCDKIVSLMPYAKDYMISRGMSSDKFIYIPNGFDDSEKSEESFELPDIHQKAIERFKQGDSFIVAYTGNFGDANEVGALISSLPFCENKKIVLLLVGKGPHLNALKKLVTEKCLSDRVAILPSIRKSSVIGLLRQVDLGFIGLKNQSMFRFGISPTKINDYFLAKLPILYAITYKDQIIEDSGVVFQCESGHPISIAEMMDYISAKPKAERNRIGEQGYKWANSTRSYSKLAIKFLDVLKING